MNIESNLTNEMEHTGRLRRIVVTSVKEVRERDNKKKETRVGDYVPQQWQQAQVATTTRQRYGRKKTETTRLKIYMQIYEDFKESHLGYEAN